MSRKKRDFSRVVLPDPKYKDLTVAKTVNALMISGKKGVAEKALYKALSWVAEKMSTSPIEVFHQALGNIRPVMEVRSRRVGGANYQIPSEVRSTRSQALAIRWLSSAASSRTEKTLAERLAAEIMDAANNRGGAVKKKEDTHRMADANKAFAHFKW